MAAAGATAATAGPLLLRLTRHDYHNNYIDSTLFQSSSIAAFVRFIVRNSLDQHRHAVGLISTRPETIPCVDMEIAQAVHCALAAEKAATDLEASGGQRGFGPDSNSAAYDRWGAAYPNPAEYLVLVQELNAIPEEVWLEKFQRNQVVMYPEDRSIRTTYTFKQEAAPEKIWQVPE
jgi:hypothetical protein